MGVISEGLGLKSADEYVDDVAAHTRLRQLQSGNQLQANNLAAAAKKRPGAGVTGAPASPAVPKGKGKVAHTGATPPTAKYAAKPIPQGSPGSFKTVVPPPVTTAPPAPTPVPIPTPNAARPAPNIGGGLPAAPVELALLDTTDVSEQAFGEAIDRINWASDPQQAGFIQEVRELSEMFELDSSATLALRTLDKRIEEWGGSLKAMRDHQSEELSSWFADPANIEAVRNAYNDEEGFTSPYLKQDLFTSLANGEYPVLAYVMYSKVNDIPVDQLGNEFVRPSVFTRNENNIIGGAYKELYNHFLGDINTSAYGLGNPEVPNAEVDALNESYRGPPAFDAGFAGAEDIMPQHRPPETPNTIGQPVSAGLSLPNAFNEAAAPSIPAAPAAPAEAAGLPDTTAAPAAPAAPAEVKPTVTIGGKEEPSSANIGVDVQTPAKFLANPPAIGQEINNIISAREFVSAQIAEQVQRFDTNIATNNELIDLNNTRIEQNNTDMEFNKQQVANNNQVIEQYNVQILDLERRAQIAVVSGVISEYDKLKAEANAIRQAAAGINAQSIELNRANNGLNRASTDLNQNSVEVNIRSADITAEAQAISQTGQVAIAEFDNKLLYATGMQAIQDLSYGSTSRASAVASAYAGLDVKIVSLSDGKFELWVEGEMQETYSYLQLVDKIQSAFSESYRASQAESEAVQGLYIFKAGVDLQAKIAEAVQLAVKDINIATITANASLSVAEINALRATDVALIVERAGLKLEELKQAGAEIKSLNDGTGMALILKDGLFYLFNPAKVSTDINGNTKVSPETKKISLDEAVQIRDSLPE